MPANPGHSKAAPTQSRAPASARPASGWSNRAATTIATTAIGTLTTKIHCQAALVDDEAADDGPEDRPEQDRHADQRERPSDALRAGALRDQRESDRNEHAAAEALQDTEGDQLAGRRRQRAQRRADGEQRDRGDPGPLGAEALGDPARERDHRRQRQQIAGRDPLDGAERRVQVPREGVQRDVDDRRVEDRHDEPEGGDAGHHERRPVEPTRQALRLAVDGRGQATEPACSTARPFAVSATSMLPRVAFEYGQIWCAALASSAASTSSSIDGSVMARVTPSA